ncbi:hypothetical protein SNE26_21010 [Mucilaginibacter sp. cycad4]|uniref:hypothetical protein n=1 Tax=Mucilaginibacter sp. cycad4 TaxID=3342096 RepID=UPI002AAB0D32|nr:hypothetical protein [Mucilaginibacter gossypii]WPU98507.1 hypothetical protein SNE26_21010 [Mucilaginibacter gossypii]
MEQQFTLEYFFFDLPIYTQIQLTNHNQPIFHKICNLSNIKIDGFNPRIKEKTTFNGLTTTTTAFDSNGGFHTIIIQCMRTGFNFYYYLFLDKEAGVFTKVGQYPSIADFHLSELNKYKKVIPNDKLKEVAKAIGLAANGVGVGSFVYLRRVFEYLIEDAKSQAIKDSAIKEDDFVRLRMDEKIQALKDYLPEFLVENKQLYGILSVGIHALEENECLMHFEAVKVGIELILDEKLESHLKKEKMDAAKAKIAQSHAQIASKK